jgi:hypothetical protein
MGRFRFEERRDFYEGEGLGESGIVERELPWVTGAAFFMGAIHRAVISSETNALSGQN